jgi:hypothetical protein
VVCAHVAQSAEHILGKDEVTGSIPVMGSREMEVVIRLKLFFILALNIK